MPAFKRLTRECRASVLAYLRGASDAVLMSGRAVWCHRAPDGTLVQSRNGEHGLDASEIDLSKSAFCWLPSGKLWM